MCSVSDIALRREPRLSCKGSLLVAMVSARCGKRSGQLRQEAEGSQSTNRNPQGPGSRHCGYIPRELSPGDSSMERQGSLCAATRADNADAAADARCRTWTWTWTWSASCPTAELSPGDSSTGGHQHPLRRLTGSLAGEQIAQPLDVLLGDFRRHRLAGRLGWRCGWWPLIWRSGC